MENSTYLAGRAINLALVLAKSGKLGMMYQEWAKWFDGYMTWDKADEKLQKIVKRLEGLNAQGTIPSYPEG